MQAGQLSAASLFDNIADASSLTMKEALEAVRAASFAEDIEAMPRAACYTRRNATPRIVGVLFKGINHIRHPRAIDQRYPSRARHRLTSDAPPPPPRESSMCASAAERSERPGPRRVDRDNLIESADLENLPDWLRQRAQHERRVPLLQRPRRQKNRA